jgi:hypothetical protein
MKTLDDETAMKVLQWVFLVVKTANTNYSPEIISEALEKLGEKREVVMNAFYTALRPEFRRKASGILRTLERRI